MCALNNYVGYQKRELLKKLPGLMDRFLSAETREATKRLWNDLGLMFDIIGRDQNGQVSILGN